MNDKINVLIVDDSPLARSSIVTILESDPNINIIGIAKNGQEAVSKALALRPHVITMDIKMPVMDGIEATRNIMEQAPMPIIILSSMSDGEIAKALEMGAMDCVPIRQGLEVVEKLIIEKVKIASRVKAVRRIKKAVLPLSIPEHKKVDPHDTNFKVVVIGASTGGPQALEIILASLPRDFPAAIIVVQHMSDGFIKGMTQWLQRSCPMNISIIENGSIIRPSQIFMAPEGKNLIVDKNGYFTLTNDNPQKILHVPSVSFTMDSVANIYSDDTIGVILTGMGRDGADGIATIKDAGGTTIAQDEATSTVFGMNKVAIESGKVDLVLPIKDIAKKLIDLI